MGGKHKRTDSEVPIVLCIQNTGFCSLSFEKLSPSHLFQSLKWTSRQIQRIAAWQEKHVDLACACESMWALHLLREQIFEAMTPSLIIPMNSL